MDEGTKSVINADEMNLNNATYTANQLGIKPITLRKYSAKVEELLGDTDRFKRGHDSRKYTDTDIDIYKKAISLKAESGITLDNALKMAFTASDENEDIGDGALSITVNNSEDIAKYNVMLNAILEENQELKKQNAEINDKLDSILNSIEDAKKSQPKRGWLSKLFN